MEAASPSGTKGTESVKRVYKFRWHLPNWKTIPEIIKLINGNGYGACLASPPQCSDANGHWIVKLEFNRFCASYTVERVPKPASILRAVVRLSTVSIVGPQGERQKGGSCKWTRKDIFDGPRKPLETLRNNLGNQEPCHWPHSLHFDVEIEEGEGPFSSPRPKLTDKSSLTMFRDKRFADVTIVVKGKELTAHKVVLCCASPVLERMLSVDMKEKREGTIVIEDASDEAWSQLLEFAYTGDISTDSLSLLWELVVLSDKYDMPALTKAIQEVAIESMTCVYAAMDIYEAFEANLSLTPVLRDALLLCFFKEWSQLIDPLKRFILDRPALAAPIYANQ